MGSLNRAPANYCCFCGQKISLPLNVLRQYNVLSPHGQWHGGGAIGYVHRVCQGDESKKVRHG